MTLLRAVVATLAVVILACGFTTEPTTATSGAVPTSTTPTATEYDPAYVASHMARVREAVGCDGAPLEDLGVFCAATSWASGSAAAVPGGSVTLLGLTTWVPTTGATVDTMRGQLSLSLLALRTTGESTYGDITSVNARNSADQAPMLAAREVQAVFAGTSSGPLTLLGPLYLYTLGRPAAATYVLARTSAGWQLQGGSYADLRRVGDRWVAVEVPRKDPQGLYLSMFTEREYAGAAM